MESISCVVDTDIGKQTIGTTDAIQEQEQKIAKVRTPKMHQKEKSWMKCP